MTKGDVVKAVWPDGLCATGKYAFLKQGYIILIGESGEHIVCDPNIVKFEVIKNG